MLLYFTRIYQKIEVDNYGKNIHTKTTMDLSNLDQQIQNKIIMYQRPTYKFTGELKEFHDIETRSLKEGVPDLFDFPLSYKIWRLIGGQSRSFHYDIGLQMIVYRDPAPASRISKYFDEGKYSPFKHLKKRETKRLGYMKRHFKNPNSKKWKN